MQLAFKSFPVRFAFMSFSGAGKCTSHSFSYVDMMEQFHVPFHRLISFPCMHKLSLSRISQVNVRVLLPPEKEGQRTVRMMLHC